MCLLYVEIATSYKVIFTKFQDNVPSLISPIAPPLLQAVDNLGTVMGNLLKTQAKMEGLKDKLSALDSQDGPELLDYSLGP